MQNEYLLANISADTAETELNFAQFLPIGRCKRRPRWRRRQTVRPPDELGLRDKDRLGRPGPPARERPGARGPICMLAKPLSSFANILSECWRVVFSDFPSNPSREKEEKSWRGRSTSVPATRCRPSGSTSSPRRICRSPICAVLKRRNEKTMKNNQEK